MMVNPAVAMVSTVHRDSVHRVMSNARSCTATKLRAVVSRLAARAAYCRAGSLEAMACARSEARTLSMAHPAAEVGDAKTDGAGVHRPFERFATGLSEIRTLLSQSELCLQLCSYSWLCAASGAASRRAETAAGLPRRQR